MKIKDSYHISLQLDSKCAHVMMHLFLSLLFCCVALHCAKGQGSFQGNCFGINEGGNCRARFPSWFFIPQSGICDCFIYTGCGNNPNRFDTLESCMKCGVKRENQGTTISQNCRNVFSGTEQLANLLSTQNVQGFYSPPSNPTGQAPQYPVQNPQRPVQDSTIDISNEHSFQAPIRSQQNFGPSSFERTDSQNPPIGNFGSFDASFEQTARAVPVPNNYRPPIRIGQPVNPYFQSPPQFWQGNDD